MAVLFVSHASRDDARANALEAWLKGNGFTDVFVDHHSIAGGDKWREELRASAAACRVVICLVTESWLASDECFGEFVAATYTFGKRIIPLFLLLPATLDETAGKRLAKVCAEDQGIKLEGCLRPDGTLDLDAQPDVAGRLKTGLRAAGANSEVGLDPQAFAIDRKLRPTPFPGLTSFGDEDADAALFYGRSREIAHSLEDLRKMRAERDRRLFVILGASGAGKSSLLKAGIIPRLRREAPAWLPLRAFRPGANPLLNFAEAISRTLSDFGKAEAHGVIRDRLFDAWSSAERGKNSELTDAGLAALEGVLAAEGHKLRAAAGRAGATILIGVDQAEEIARAEGASADSLADYLRVALAAGELGWQLAFTIRTDSFPELQSHRRFRDLEARGYDLRALPRFRFVSVVEEPARRYGVEIEPHLVDALMEDAPDVDALPLLAFALQRLWAQFAATGALTRESYDKIGRLKMLIQDAAERALRGIEPDQDVPLPSSVLPKRLDELGASTFVPALAQLNHQGAAIGRPGAWTSFNDEQQELLGRFDRWRLVVRKGAEAGGGTVEVTHEALFREWARLTGWLEPERARLEALRALQADASTWDRHGREATFLNHRDERLAEADALAETEGYRARLGMLELDYLDSCRATQRLARGRRRRMQALVGMLTLGLVAGLAAWWNEGLLRKYYFWIAQVRELKVAEERALKPGDAFWECVKTDDRYSKLCPEMVVIPADRFKMGSPEGETGEDNESPQHEVTIAKPFAVSRYEVTFDQWDACVAAGGCSASRAGKNMWGIGRLPMNNVTWDDAKDYVKWLSEVTSRQYRLLSEAEWEYAARAGSTTAYFWGDEIASGKANANCNGCGWWDDKFESRSDGPRAALVGTFPANKFGLHDMHGNVAEWVEDCYREDYDGAPVGYDGAPTDGSPLPERGYCELRVVRGGAYNSAPPKVRSAARDAKRHDAPFTALGFRVARTLSGR